MTFEEYMKAVREQQLLGGLDEVGCFVAALRLTRIDLWDQVKEVKYYDPTIDPKYMAGFLLFVYINWYK